MRRYPGHGPDTNLESYYSGRMVSDVLSMVIGTGETVVGIVEVIGAVGGGAGISIGSGGTLLGEGITIGVAGATAGTALAVAGSAASGRSVVSFGSDMDKYYDARMNAESGGNSGSSGGNIEGAGKKQTKLYRVMSQNEYDSIMSIGGKFTPYDYAMEEKWFATTPQDAAQWGSKFYPDGNYRMIEIEMPSSTLNQMYYNNHLDGIGPAYSGGINLLNSFMKGIRVIK
jgi:hypothetical protein